jgi:hypothetical protein
MLGFFFSVNSDAKIKVMALFKKISIFKVKERLPHAK